MNVVHTTPSEINFYIILPHISKSPYSLVVYFLLYFPLIPLYGKELQLQIIYLKEPTIGTESFHEISNRVANFATYKNLTIKSTMSPHRNIHMFT
jgi:hypothetical protein